MVFFDIFMRWLHIFPAIALVGGAMYMRFVLYPAVEPLSIDERQNLQEALRLRWANIVMTSVALLLASGLFNYITIARKWDFDEAKFYHPVMGVKMLLGLVVMFLASSLAGRSERAKRMRDKGTYWTTINLVLAMLVVGLGGVARVAVRTPKPVEVSSVVETPEQPLALLQGTR